MATNPLNGPHMTAREITDSSSDPGYALTPLVAPGAPGPVAWTLARLGYTRGDEKAA